MAVTQISRIQVRRGRKKSPTGIPQLASGEIAWAVDSQELFIGNGSVAEGAPYVGNTKILTEHDNILALISSYKFGGSDEDSVTPFSVARSFQSKLDEYVSVLDFGAVGDGVSDNVFAFETAFTQLFQNTNEIYKKVLVVPNGEYVFDSDLRVPRFVILAGETQNGVTLRFTNGSGLKFVEEINGFEKLEDYTLERRPGSAVIGNLVIESAQSDLTGAKDIRFDRVIFKGNYVLSEPYVIDTTDKIENYDNDALKEFLDERNIALFWNNTRSGFETTGIEFQNCQFRNLEIALECDQTTANESQIKFYDCDFDSLDFGIIVLGITDQRNKWRFSECRFSNTANHALFLSAGIGMHLRECEFEKCGNYLDGTPATPSVYFGQSQDNLLIECSNDRQQSRGITTNEQALYVPEVIGADTVSFITRNKAFIEIVESFTPIAIFSASNDFMEIGYSMILATGDVRNGKLKITMNKDDGIVDLTDDFTYSSPLSGGNTVTNIQFQVRLVDNDNSTGVETVLLEYRQLSAGSGSAGTLSFDVSYGSIDV